MGRKKLPPAQRTVVQTLRVSYPEKDLWQAYAELVGVPLSELIRRIMNAAAMEEFERRQGETNGH